MKKESNPSNKFCSALASFVGCKSARTGGGFRDRLAKVSGLPIDPSEAQAHHVFPVKFGKEFRQVGIEPNNYGAWWATDVHRSNSGAYNKAWQTFFRSHQTTGYTAEDCFIHLNDLKNIFHF